MKQLRLKSSVC